MYLRVTTGYATVGGCACHAFPIIDPNGDVRQCECRTASVVGNVFDGFEYPAVYGDCRCVRHRRARKVKV